MEPLAIRPHFSLSGRFPSARQAMFRSRSGKLYSVVWARESEYIGLYCGNDGYEAMEVEPLSDDPWDFVLVKCREPIGWLSAEALGELLND